MYVNLDKEGLCLGRFYPTHARSATAAESLSSATGLRVHITPILALNVMKVVDRKFGNCFALLVQET